MLEKYNVPQREAILAGDGPILVVAGAGSGKTSVLTQRVVYLIEQKNVSPGNILAVTFTNKAANKMKGRISKLSQSLNRQILYSHPIWIGTFHAIAVRMLHPFI
ncbi:MAG: UvrD-helicase domain-containing protein, partial [Candidatus Atribacteria bacterium]|nr:UvrD-helicase domain-containing protein [Candidatus Atribacteria bacterium]